MSTSSLTASAHTNTPEYDPFAGPAIAAAVATTDPQREIWTAALVSDDASLSYNESITLSMRGPCQVEALRTALAEVALRHESLRATFSADGLTMLIADSGEVPFEVVDASALDDASRDAAWRSLLDREVTEPFDLARGPLARVKVFRVAPEEHRVVFTAHHIVCDGWSTAVIVGDWAATYSAHVKHTTPNLGPADSFGAYAREQATRDDEAADEAFWLGRFADSVPVLELPVDRPRPPLKTYGSTRFDQALDETLVRDLRRVSSAERASLFVTLLTGFHTLMARLSGQDDVVVGIPAAGQSVRGHASLVGHCVNMLPIRARPVAERTFRELLVETRSAVLDAQEHQQYTYGKLLRRLPLSRDPSRLPLVSVVFNLDRGLGPDGMAFDGLQTELTTNPRRFENFDLFLNAVELGGRITFECQYNTDLFDGDTIRRWLGVYAHLLRSICDNPAERVGWLRFVPEAEITQLDAWNAATHLPFDRTARVHELFERQVAATPDAIAVQAEDETLTYAELDARAEALAFALRDAGVQRGALVGLCVERSARLLVGLFGVLKAGAAYVPLDPGYPMERLTFMVRESGMRALVTEAKVRSEVALDAPRVVVIESVQPRAGRVSDEGDATPDDPAYVIYTSGSTGVPKGVLVPHRAVVNLLHSVRATPGMAASDAVLAVTTLSFDIAVSELILPLVVGARIVLATREVASDGARLLALMHASKATFLDATPATWRLLLAAGWSGGEGLKAICTGEALPPDLAGELLARCASVWNGYGPTETTVWSTFWRVEPLGRRILIGKPVANTDLYVVDPRMQRVPIGVVGELFIGGAGVTLGYHDRPELTRERFLPDPFSQDGGARMYKTGDLVRYLPSGDLECLGRNDSQVKLRGYRIELGEIENVLGQHPGVRQAAVLVREDRPGDRRLVGYVVAPSDSGPSDADLRAHLKRTLPDYMVPQQFVRLDIMPLLPNGKVDRKRVPAPQATRSEADDDFVAPTTEREKLLAGLWEEVLAVGRIGIHDDFFALGGHSLLASQLIARLKREHGIDLSFRKIFEAPTVAKLAQAIDGPSVAAAPRAALVAARGTTAPLTLAQRRMWLLEEMEPEQRAVHNLVASWRLEGPLDLQVLQRSIDEIVRRQDVLRTNFRSISGETMQVIDQERTISVRLVDLTALPEVDREGALALERDASVALPFRLDADPLVRFILFRLASDRHVLTTVQHNIIWDGWSFDIFLRDLSALYSAFVRNEPSPLPLLPIAYGDFAHWQNDWMASDDCAAQSAFWRGRLAVAPLPLQLPTDRPRKGTRSHVGKNEGIHLPASRAEELTALARQNGATLFMVVFAAFNVVLHRRTGQRELLVGTPMRARTQPELEGLIGLFVNTVALTTAVEPSMSFLELLGRVREVTLDAFTNQDVPLDALGIRPPMMRALFSLQDATARPLRMGELTIVQEHALAPVAATELMLWVMESRTSMLLMLNFASDLFDVATARRWLRELDTVLEQVLRAPGQPIGTMPILPREELEAIAAACGEAAPVQSTIIGAVREVASGKPAAVALEWAGGSLTYSDLVRRTAAAAHGLVARGIGAGSRVALRVGAPDDVMVGALAVMALGAVLDFTATEPRPEDISGIPERDGRDDWPSTEVAPNAIAYVDHGIAARQGMLARALASAAEETGIASGEALLLASPLTSAASLCAWLLPVFAGARLVVASDADAFRARAASNPAAVGVLDASSARLPEGTAIHALVTCGRPSAAQVARLLKDVADLRIVELSAAVGAPISVHRASPPEAPVGWGRPLKGTRWRVVDPEGQLVPVGVPGELRVDFGEGFAATGDRVRLLDVGSFEHLGRIDGRIVLQGALIDPGKVARALEGHPAVREAWVMVCDDLAGEPRVVAFFAAQAGASWTETELRKRVRSEFGDAVVPRVFVELDALPRDVTGAVNEERLTSPYAAQSARDYVAPRTPPEKYLAEVWQEALGVARIGAFDNFFDLGGHSLLCFRVIARIEREKGVRLSPRLFLLNSLEQVAAHFAGSAPDEALAAAPAGTSPAVAPRPTPIPPAPTRAGTLRDWIRKVVKR
jgi:amino acid adenylation domain-containing protein